jgi:hypothetical protein
MPPRAVIRPSSAIAIPIALSLLVFACGYSRTKPPNLSAAAAPSAWRALKFPAAGVSVVVPSNWTIGAGGNAQLVLAAASGLARVELWRYPRKQPLPNTAASLRRARRALVRAARARDPHLHVIRARSLTVDGARAIELSVTEVVGGQLRRDRSLHVFTGGAELVLDVYAPVNDFHAVDHSVFSPLKRSLQLFPALA